MKSSSTNAVKRVFPVPIMLLGLSFQAISYAADTANPQPSDGATLPASGPSTSSMPGSNDFRTERVKLFFYRDAAALKTVLDDLEKVPNSSLSGLTIQVIDENRLALSGTKATVRQAERLISVIDFPVPSVQMEIWGIQISSRNPNKMAIALQDVQSRIEEARSAVADLYSKLQLYASLLDIDEGFAAKMTADVKDGGLGYTDMFYRYRSLTLTDILLRLVAAKDCFPDGEAAAQERPNGSDDIGAGVSHDRGQTRVHASGPTGSCYGDVDFANNVNDFLKTRYKYYVDSLSRQGELRDGKASRQFGKVPLERFFTRRGLVYQDGTWTLPNTTARTAFTTYNRVARMSVMQFALSYAESIDLPNTFSAYYLQQTAGTLNDRLQPAIQALTEDIYDLFLAPTLEDIRKTVGSLKDVEYAQVGRINVASLDGVETTVSGEAVSPIPVTRPLTLDEMSTALTTLQSSLANLIPSTTGGGTAGGGTAGGGTTGGGTGIAPTILGLPASRFLALISVLSAQQVYWRVMKPGITLDVTPHVLRNASTTELAFNLTIGDPLSSTSDSNAPDLARVSQHNVKSTVYINPLDIFDLSTFSSEATLNGGRAYFPLIGPLWHGIFGDTSVLGDLFSWKRSPRSVYHQSMILSNVVVNPTAAGIALLYPQTAPGNEPEAQRQETFKTAEKSVNAYMQAMSR